MRKTTILAAILALALTACSVNAATPSNAENVTASSSEIEVKSAATVSSSQVSIETDSISTSSSKSMQSSSSSTMHPSAASENPAPAQPKPQVSAEPTPEKPQPSPTAPETSAPQPEQTPATVPTPPPAPAPAAPKTAYDAPYDTGTIVADAQAYGNALGMTWSDDLNTGNCSWEAPISTSAVLSGERLKAAIESGIRRVQKLQQDNGYQSGEFHFKVYLEASGSEYTIYFLMG